MDPHVAKLLNELEADPGNRGLLSVLGDRLQQVGDPRGELVVLDLTASTEPEALARRRELCIELAPPYSVKARPTWGIGYLRKLELAAEGGSLAKHAATFAHPSCRLLESVTLGTHHALGVKIPDALLPRSLRTLVLYEKLSPGSDLTGLPYLEHLGLRDAARLIHPTLSSLTLDNPSERLVATLTADDLPGVRKLTIRNCDALTFDCPILAQLDELVLEQCRFDGDVLEAALDGRKLPRLVIHPHPLAPLDRHQLAALCDTFELKGSVKTPEGTFVEHTGKPEWGRGRIVKEIDGKVEIEFPSGTRVLKDGPYLKRVR